MRRILQTATVVGLSSLISVAMGALRYKVIASELGASGVGFLGILTAAAAFAVTLFSVGLATSGVQSVASAAEDPARRSGVRTALVVGTSVGGLLGGLAATVFGMTLGTALLPGNSSWVVFLWLGIAVASTIASAGLLAILNGEGRIHALAICNTVGALIGTVVTVIVVPLSGEAGLVASLAGAPVATLACSWIFVRIRRPPRFGSSENWLMELRMMLPLGISIMLALLLTSAGQLVVRLWLEHVGGIVSAGYFQAAWTISSLYLTFVLGGLSAEYYPRISAQMTDARQVNKSVDDQARIALTLGAPALLWIIALAPQILQVLYAPEFQAAVTVLRWQLLGDVFKIVSWAIAFLLLARRAKLRYFIAELIWNGTYLALALPLSVQFGFRVLGPIYVAVYVVYLAAVSILARRETGLRLGSSTWVLLAVFTAVGGAALLSSELLPQGGGFVAGALALGATIGSVVLLRRPRDRKPATGTLPPDRPLV